MARGLKFQMKEVEGLCYPCSENKGADLLYGYREADLSLCFSHMQKAGFLNEAHINAKYCDVFFCKNEKCLYF